MGPLSGKQQREYISLNAKLNREDQQAAAEEARKEELHKIKLAEAKAKANQTINQKHDTHAAKMQEIGGPLSAKPVVASAVNLSQPTNPEAGAGDTVPAMLTPGEAVIPAPVAQDPQYKPAIEHMVSEGRYRNGTGAVPQQVQSAAGYEDGTTSVADKIREFFKSKPDTKQPPPPPPKLGGMAGEAQKVISGRGAQLEEQERKIMGYEDGTTGVGLVPALTAELAKHQPGTDGYQIINSELEKARGSQKYAVVPAPTDVPPLQREISRAVKAGGDEDQLRLLNSELEMAQGTKPRVVSNPEDTLARDASNKDALMREMARHKVGSKEYDILAAELDKVGGGSTPSTIKGIPPISNQAMSEPRPSPEEVAYANQVLGSKEMMGTPQQIEAQKVITRERKYQGLMQGVPAIQQSSSSGMGLTPVGREPSVPATGVIPTTIAELDAQKKSRDPSYIPKPATDLTDDNVYSLDAAPTAPPPEGYKLDLAPEAREEFVADYSLGNKDSLEAKWREVADTDAPPEEKKSMLAGWLEDLYGPSGLFNRKELIRFSLLAAGGMLTGGSVNGSLRYAAKDTLAAADKRDDTAQRAELAYAKMDSQERRTEMTRLTAMGYSVDKVKKYLETGNSQDLGAAPIQRTPTGKYETFYIDSGPFAGREFKATEYKSTVGGKEHTTEFYIQGVPAQQFIAAYSKSQDPSVQEQLQGASLVPKKEWADKQDKSEKAWSSYQKNTTDVIKDAYNVRIGQSSDNRGGGNPKWASKPLPASAAAQAAEYFRSIGTDIHDTSKHTALNMIVANAVEDMLSQNSVGAETDFTPYLVKSRLIGRSGVDPSAFQLGDGKPMKAQSIETLVKRVDSSLQKQSQEPLKGSELEQKRNAKLNELYRSFKSKSERNRWQDAEGKTAFYLYALSKL
jgi:hypothetical protein